MMGTALNLFVAATAFASVLLTSGNLVAGTTPPVFTIVDRASWNPGDIVDAPNAVSDSRGGHWVAGATSGPTRNPWWRLRSYEQDQTVGTDREAYVSSPLPEATRVNSLASKEHLVVAVGSVASGAGSRGIARISYDSGATWNDLNEFSCGPGQLTQYTAVGFYDTVTVFLAGFCVDLTGSARWFVRRGLFDESEMQWFWSNSDQLVGRPGVNNIASHILVTATGEVLVFGKVQNERSSGVSIRSSTDKGRTWRTVATPATSVNSLVALKVISAENGRMLLLLGEGVSASQLSQASILSSIDNGRTWSVIHQWAITDGVLGATGDLMVRGTELIAVGSAVSTNGSLSGWLKRSVDGGGTWTQFDSNGEFSAGAQFLGLNQIGSSPVYVSGVDRMVTGEHRITYRAFRPPR